MSGTIMAWGAVGLVIVVIAVLVIVKVPVAGIAAARTPIRR